MAKLHELKEKRNTIAKEMRDMHEKAGDDTWTDEQRSNWKKAKSSLDVLDEQIQREEDLRSLDVDHARDNTPEKKQNPESPEEKRSAAFNKFMRGGREALNSEERKILEEMRAQSTGTGTAGGYTVPTTMLNRIVDIMKSFGGIAGICQVMTTESGEAINWPTSDGTAEEGELIGENSVTSEDDIEFGSVALGAKKLSSKVIRVSNELLSDSGLDMEAYISNRIGLRLWRGESRYLVQGNGSGLQPKGLEAAVTGTVAASGATAINWKDLNAIKHAVDPAYRAMPGFRFAFNDNTLKLISNMEDGQGRPLWLPAVAGLAPATILGVQYAIDQAIADIAANKKFLYAGDFNRFILRRIKYMALRRLVERYADYDQTGFLAFHRFDCVLEDTAAIKALAGKSA
ncbi:phage major capsid protein [Escherichia coli]|uniref:phage major capsid protein n=1 Tax=Escherichia coli TaxID=562 RepID=UPI000B7E6D7A|nr:phage major capsid protein [Escherichia coli]EET3366319.1 phage major capsid protein [Escherichia coli]EET9690671.1 phage major capsid protein [Escherichia coli]EEY4012827.1 phage major capsid protein [Escherichia coli]EFC4678169.1 phage major capsid protein [Escherichia coli]EFD5475579.1 phage major capsid protein [Escherichia coli]